ncbi:hypothetical protein BCON_0018g00170 [Botryotinia convoluta]|uniref:Uncharacterized protein n=1 Tax=Botryotinia convoluta TaxID=54673 RepID=A0A4Z1IPS0_9HELO|nr:hypothetical protein BCON_0018g00170 [Botryotinia convoluta]
MTASSKIPDQTRNKSDQNRRKDNEMCDTTVQWPADVRVLREALRELNEEHEKMNLGDPPDTPIGEINARKRAWYRSRVEYLDAIKDLLFRRYQLDGIKKPKLPTLRTKHD